MVIVIALGGNALLSRGEPLEADIQRKNVQLFSTSIAELAKEHQIIICHGNGPQVGLLALSMEAYGKVSPYPLDVLDAESQGMIGYLIQQGVGNLVSKPVVTILSQVAVDIGDAAFNDPSKPIGPVYLKEQAKAISAELGWTIKPDGKYFRRVVPSPKPVEIVELDTIKLLMHAGTIVICGGGGGIPVVRGEGGKLKGIEAVIDKDNTASLIAEKLNADMLLTLTAVDAIYTDFNTPKQRAIKVANPEDLLQMQFPKGSMGPKVQSSCRFAKNTNKTAIIGNLTEIKAIIKEESGSRIDATESGITYYN
jgi:carbamate kinase